MPPASDEQKGLFLPLEGGSRLMPSVTRLHRRIVDAAVDIMDGEPDDPAFMHAVLCQVGLPRSPQEELSFTRQSGGASLRIEAGKLFNGHEWVQSPLPFGAKPRLILYHICSEAIRTRSPEIPLGDSVHQFLRRLRLDISGPEYQRLKKQMSALAACRLQLGFSAHDAAGFATRTLSIETKPIREFEAWIHNDGGTRSMFPARLVLSLDFMETLLAHAVPLDPRAIHALQGSALALDVYTWLAHRLCRVRKDAGIMLYWKPLREQFGQEYKSDKNFKKEFKAALRKVKTVYPAAHVEDISGGLRLYPSAPPVKKLMVPVAQLLLGGGPVVAANQVPSEVPPAATVVIELTPTTFEQARMTAPGWDVHWLANKWQTEHLPKVGQPKFPQKAFLGWCRRFTKGRRPA